jgi:hypothetical protein
MAETYLYQRTGSELQVLLLLVCILHQEAVLLGLYAWDDRLDSAVQMVWQCTYIPALIIDAPLRRRRYMYYRQPHLWRPSLNTLSQTYVCMWTGMSS